MIKAIVLMMLALETFSDIRTKTVSGLRIIIFIIIGIPVNIIMRYQTLWSAVGGILVGGILLIYAFITKGGIGIGDGLMFVCLGIYLGLSVNLRLLFFSLITAAVLGGIYAVIKKRSIKSQIPFIPCVLSTYLIILIMEGSL